jgi:CRP/FNR family transcriptional regulator, cyclic AMP receptor protein
MSEILGYAASCAVLATFLMRTMVPLRLVAILSNILFVAFAYLQNIHPILFLHMALLPINVWRLFALRQSAGAPLIATPFARKRLPNI